MDHGFKPLIERSSKSAHMSKHKKGQNNRLPKLSKIKFAQEETRKNITLGISGTLYR